MANVLEKFGLRPSRQLNGSPFINAQNRYRIAANNTTSIYQGDLVIPTAAGTITRYVAGSSATNTVVGVFNGCFYTDPTTQKPTWKNYYPASTNASDITAFVIDGPDTVFEINSSGTIAVAGLFSNYDVVNTTGSTQTGISFVQLDGASVNTTNTLPLMAIDISQDPNNSDVAATNANIVVRINNHFYKQNQTGF
jgi:hypothetical protein